MLLDTVRYSFEAGGPPAFLAAWADAHIVDAIRARQSIREYIVEAARLRPRTPYLIEAIRAGSRRAFDELLAAGLDLDAVEAGVDAQTPLMVACGRPQSAYYADALIARGANVNYRSPTGWTALHMAARFGCAAQAAKLIAHNADTEARAGRDRKTPLDMADAALSGVIVRGQRMRPAPLPTPHRSAIRGQ